MNTINFTSCFLRILRLIICLVCVFRCASISCTDHRHLPKLDWRIETGDSCLTALSPSVLYSIHGNDMSGQSGHPSQSISVTHWLIETGYELQFIFDSSLMTNVLVYSVFFSNCKMYLFKMAKCFCSKLQNVLVSSCKICLSKSFWYLCKLVYDQFY